MITDFLEFDDDVDLLDIISEASRQKEKINNIQNSIKTMFSHMIKYQYNPRRQTKSWVSTIIREYKNIISYSIKELNRYIDTDILDESYKNGRNEAVNEDEDNIIHKIAPKSRPYNWDLEFITSLDCIVDFLNINEYNLY